MARSDSAAKRAPDAPVAQALAILFGLLLTLAAWAQTIRIPDFRAPPPTAELKPGEACTDCGRIQSIREVRVDRASGVTPVFQGAPGSSSGLAEQNLVGAVVALPLGGETAERPFVGGVGTPEARERFRESSYEIVVRLDNGALRRLQRYDGTRYRIGDRVRLSGIDQIELVAE